MQAKTIAAIQGETLKVSNQWAAQTEKRGTSVSSSSWTYSGSGTPASAVLVTTLATVTLAPTSSGLLTNTVVLANGETLVQYRNVEVTSL